MKLFIPGPVDVRQEILEVMSKPMIGHRTKEISTLQKKIEIQLQALMFTKNPVLLSTTSGTGAMEMAVRGLTKKKLAVFSMGAFGDRFYEIAVGNGIEADKISFDYGKPVDLNVFDKTLESQYYDTITITHNETSTGVMNDLESLSKIWKKYPEIIVIVDAVSSFGGFKIDVDQLGIDVLVSASQKALGLPPGLAVLSVSDKAQKRMNNINHQGFYLSLKHVFDKHVKSYQYPTTPNISLMKAMHAQLTYIIDVEGIENRFNRHQMLANVTRAWVKKHFKLFALKGYESQTVTTVWNTKSLDLKMINERLFERGYLFAPGYGAYKDKAFRIAHMGDRTLEELETYLKEIESLWL